MQNSTNEKLSNPHLEGLIRPVIAEMRQPENSGQFGPWQFTADNIRDWADRIEAALAALPGGGVLTYDNQPDNLGAWRLGEACRAAQPGGDLIDHGLSLLQQLQAKGYGVVALPTPNPHEADQ